MKYLIASDIHGALDSATFLYNLIKNNKYDHLILLGDILYHGPRNNLPDTYNPKEVVRLFNEIKDKITCIRGNCDSEVDLYVLEFIFHDSLILKLNNISFNLIHGQHLKLDGDIDILNNYPIIYGHYHKSLINNINNRIYLNPGSISLPKDNKRSFATLCDNEFIIYDLYNNILNKMEF